MTCAVCGEAIFERAHVRPKRSFDDRQDDERNNIIRLCPTHHTKFDNGKIGICESKERFVVKEGTSLRTEEPKSAISHVDIDYINYRNERCVRKVKFRLGIIPGSEHGSWCR
ncbi:HNH endonuclease [Haloferax denitrificans]|uniref:HNH endonuclease n=1 Tax=Haloferax denitrificans TaxID=35745 RepID=UPI003C704B40